MTGFEPDQPIFLKRRRQNAGVEFMTASIATGSASDDRVEFRRENIPPGIQPSEQERVVVKRIPTPPLKIEDDPGNGHCVWGRLGDAPRSAPIDTQFFALFQAIVGDLVPASDLRHGHAIAAGDGLDGVALAHPVGDNILRVLFGNLQCLTRQ